MRFGKHIKGGTKGKSIVLTASLILLIVALVGGTLAFIVARTGTVTNTFTVADIPNRIVEDFDGETKKNVAIQSTTEQDEDAYIRAAIIVTWAKVQENENGDWVATGEVHSSVPVLGTDYSMTLNLKGVSVNGETTMDDGTVIPDAAGEWILGADGFYYFTGRVSKEQYTDILITECKQLTDASVPQCSEADIEKGLQYVLSVEIVSQSIQADGVDSTDTPPVILAWGEDNGGSVTGVDGASGILSIKGAAE